MPPLLPRQGPGPRAETQGSTYSSCCLVPRDGSEGGRDLDALDSVADALCGQALVRGLQGADIEQLRPIYEEAGRVVRLSGSPDSLVWWLADWGSTIHLHDPHLGASLLDEAEAMCRGLEGSGGLTWVLLRRAAAAVAIQDWDAATDCLTEAESLARTIQDAGLLSEVILADLELLARVFNPTLRWEEEDPYKSWRWPRFRRLSASARSTLRGRWPPSRRSWAMGHHIRQRSRNRSGRLATSTLSLRSMMRSGACGKTPHRSTRTRN